MVNMGPAIISFLVIVFFLAIITVDSYAFLLLYLFAGGFLISRWWINHNAASLKFDRTFEKYAFPGEHIPVSVNIKNTSRIPIVWLRAQELLPPELSSSKILQHAFSITGHGQEHLEYQLNPQKRGYYALGPLRLSTGDLLGLVTEKVITGKPDFLTVFPRVLPLSSVNIPSHSPLGELRFKKPIFEDASRPMGKREYLVGDSIRRIDWKASASSQKLQVKVFEPSIALETVIFLNLNTEEYHPKFRYDASELAIVVAGSLANWIIERKQSVGLIVNGEDPLSNSSHPQPIQPKRGRGQRMRLLELLARVQLRSSIPIEQILHRERVNFRWGTTLILLTGSADENLFREFFHLRQSGLNIVLILCGETPDAREIKLRSNQFKLPFFHIRDEKDLEIWK